MPVYVFKKNDEEYVELFLTYEELMDRQIEREGKQYIRLENGEEAKRVYTPFGGMSSSVWPKRSVAAGVAPEQVAEATKYDRENGVPTQYDKRTGDAIYTSLNHQRQHLKLHGLVDRDGFI